MLASAAKPPPKLPGCLGAVPPKTPAEDPRLDPMYAQIQQMMPMPPVPTVPENASMDEKAKAVHDLDEAFMPFAGMVPPGLAAVEEQVVCQTWQIPGVDGNKVTLHMVRPKGAAGDAVLPCVYHVHGGGMSMMSTTDMCFHSARVQLAAKGVCAIGVEFRNAAGGRVYGPNAPLAPFPAGLNDCLWGLAHVYENKAALNISTIVLNGESGGGNLICAMAILAKREGSLHMIDGVFASCPFVSGLTLMDPADWGSISELPSVDENNFDPAGPPIGAAFIDLYTPPGSRGRDDAAAWPLKATETDLEGLPPHVIVVNELDSLRDEGLEYHRKLRRANVRSRASVVIGTGHGGDLGGAFNLVPEIGIASMNALLDFIRTPKVFDA